MMSRFYRHFGPWGAVLVSLIVLGGFIPLCVGVLFHEVPAGSRDLANILLGSLATMAANVVNYWTGSSSGSARKDEILGGKK